MTFLYLLCHPTPSRSRGFHSQVNKSENFQWNLILWGLCVLFKPQKLFYVQIKGRSCPVPLSLCVAAVSQTNSQCPLKVSEALHAWKEECVTIISPKGISGYGVRAVLIDVCSGTFLKELSTGWHSFFWFFKVILLPLQYSCSVLVSSCVIWYLWIILFTGVKIQCYATAL